MASPLHCTPVFECVRLYFVEAEEMELELAEAGEADEAGHSRIRTRWITDTTKEACKAEAAFQQETAPTLDRTLCSVCLYVVTRRVSYHVRQHHCRYFCSCGYSSQARDAVTKHHGCELPD